MHASRHTSCKSRAIGKMYFSQNTDRMIKTAIVILSNRKVWIVPSQNSSRESIPMKLYWWHRSKVETNCPWHKMKVTVHFQVLAILCPWKELPPFTWTGD